MPPTGLASITRSTSTCPKSVLHYKWLGVHRGVCQSCHLLAMEPPKKRVARRMASSCRGSLCDGLRDCGHQKCGNPGQWHPLGTISMYLHCLFCIPIWFTTDQKTPAERAFGVEGMVTDWYTRRKREIAVEVGWGGHMYTVCILVTYADARHK